MQQNRWVIYCYLPYSNFFYLTNSNAIYFPQGTYLWTEENENSSILLLSLPLHVQMLNNCMVRNITSLVWIEKQNMCNTITWNWIGNINSYSWDLMRYLTFLWYENVTYIELSDNSHFTNLVNSLIVFWKLNNDTIKHLKRK